VLKDPSTRHLHPRALQVLDFRPWVRGLTPWVGRPRDFLINFRGVGGGRGKEGGGEDRLRLRLWSAPVGGVYIRRLLL